MSKGTVCKCADRTAWVIWQYHCNYSAFSGYQKTYSDYSQIRCTKCNATWRTKAKYVNTLKHETK